MGLLDGDYSGLLGGNSGMPLGLSPQAFGLALMANSGPSRMPHSMLSDIGQSAGMAQQLQGQQYQNAIQQMQLPMMAQKFQLMQSVMGGGGGPFSQPIAQTQPQAQLSQGATPAAVQSGNQIQTLFPPTQSGPGVSTDLMRRALMLEALVPGSGKELINKSLPGYENVREGGTVIGPDGKVLFTNPKIPANMQIYQAPDGSVQALPVPGAFQGAAINEGIKNTAELNREKQLEQFKYGVEFGGAPSPEAAAQPNLPPMPGVNQPLPTQQGTNIPPLKDAAPISGAAAYLKARVPQWAETENEWGKALPSNLIAEQRGLAIADALKRTESGQWATEKSDVAASLHAVGIDLPTNILGDPAQVQRALKDNFASVLQQIKAFSNRPAAAEVILGQKNFSNPNLQPEANLSIISETVGQMRWERAMLNDWAQAKQMGWRDPQDFQRAWTKANPLQGFIDKTKAEIGPLKGMPGGPGSPPTIDPDAARAELIRRGIIKQ